MDYLGWELERQRAALRALLGGGGPEEDEPLRKKGPAGDGEAAGGKTRRSPEGRGAARFRAALRKAGRYAEEAGEALAEAPGIWETPREAAGDRVPGEGGGPEAPADAAAESPVGRAASGSRERRAPEEGAPSRRRALEETGSRAGRDGAAELWSPFGGWAGEWGNPAEEPAAETGLTAETAGERRAKERFTAEEKRPAAGGAGLEERLIRTLPWGERWESAALRAEEGAKALSRAVQRDARRYDGGFTIY